MKVLLRRDVLTVCPIDGEQVSVKVEIGHSGTVLIAADRINSVLEELAAKPILQEDLTRALGERFSASFIETVGVHQGVQITCLIGTR